MTLAGIIESAQRHAALPPIDATLAETWQEVFDARYTGPLTMHCIEGVPKTIELPNGARIALDR